MIQWLNSNKEWVFSGIGIFIFGLIISLFNKNKNKECQNQSVQDINSNSSIIINQLIGSGQIKVEAPQREKANIKIVDLYEKKDSQLDTECYLSIVELKLLNYGDEVAFIKELKIETMNHWNIYSDQYPRITEVSARYDLKISEKIGAINKLKISHEIKPQETDRIECRLSTDYFGDPCGLSLFLLKVTVIYNESNRETSSLILLDIPSEIEICGSYFHEYTNATISKNRKVAKEIFMLDQNIFIPDNIQDTLNSWLNAPHAK